MTTPPSAHRCTPERPCSDPLEPHCPPASYGNTATEAPGMVMIRQDDLEHLLDWHNKPCGDAEDAGMFERLLAAIPREAVDGT